MRADQLIKFWVIDLFGYAFYMIGCRCSHVFGYFAFSIIIQLILIHDSERNVVFANMSVYEDNVVLASAVTVVVLSFINFECDLV